MLLSYLKENSGELYFSSGSLRRCKKPSQVTDRRVGIGGLVGIR